MVLGLTKIYGNLPIHRSLRVLRTSSFNLSSLGSLIHLRYLGLYNLQIKTLPKSIYSLRKLEILKLQFLANLISLPKHLTR
ncbi:leucine-rich repeat domain-containing protein, partial [Salmonella enterica]